MHNQRMSARGALESQYRTVLRYLGTVSGWRGRSHATDALTRRAISWVIIVLALLCLPGYVGEAYDFLSLEFSGQLSLGEQRAIALASGLSAGILHYTIYLVGAASARAGERALFGAVLELPGGHRIGAFSTALVLSSLFGFLPVIPFGHVSALYVTLLTLFVAVAVVVVFYSAIARLPEARRLPTMLGILGVSALGAMSAMPLCAVFDGSLLT